MKKIFTLLALLSISYFLAPTNSKAQDIHFSQFYSAPLLLNPALTGNTNGNARIGLIFRSQYASLAPYTTIGASYDMSVLGCQLRNDHAGVGLAVYNDRSGDGGLNNITGLISAAFHKGLDSESRYFISLGGQAGFTQKSIDFTRLRFASQIINDTFDPTLANGESIENNIFSYFDFIGGGLLSAAPSANVNFYVGGSFHHFTKPIETYLVPEVADNPDILNLPSRLTVHGGGSFFLGETLSLSPSVLYMQQGSARQINYGAALGFHFNRNSNYGNGSALYVGAWNRWNDALIITVGIDYNDLNFGFSYDVNISNLNVATQSQGAVELSLGYRFKTSECDRSGELPCPRF